MTERYENAVCTVNLAPIAHKLATATAHASALTAFCSVGLLDILQEYECGGLGRKLCQSGAFTVSLRQPMRKGGKEPVFSFRCSTFD
jgi:hypothetical protein